MRCVLELTLLVLLLAGVGGVRAQDATLMARSGPVVDSAEWERSTARTPTVDSARWRILQVTPTDFFTPAGTVAPIQAAEQQRTHASLLVRQWGLRNKVFGRAPGTSPLLAGQTRILQIGSNNVVLPARVPGRHSFLDRFRARPIGEVVGIDNRLLVAQGTRTTPAVRSVVGPAAQLGRSNRATIRQTGRDNLVRQILQAGIANRVCGQQYGAQNILRVHQAGVDSTARVRQNGAGNTAIVVQNGSDV